MPPPFFSIFPKETNRKHSLRGTFRTPAYLAPHDPKRHPSASPRFRPVPGQFRKGDPLQRGVWDHTYQTSDTVWHIREPPQSRSLLGPTQEADRNCEQPEPVTMPQCDVV